MYIESEALTSISRGQYLYMEQKDTKWRLATTNGQQF